MKIKATKKLISMFFVLCMVFLFVQTPTFASSTEISKVEIGPAEYNYHAGDKPKATARASGESMLQYDIEYEYWEEMEKTSGNEIVPVKYWYSDESKYNALSQDKKITTFEEGKSYMYSISLKAREGYTFADNCEVFVNSVQVNAKNVTKNASGLFVTAIKTINPTKPVTKQEFDVVEINNATLNFKDGDKPAFTATKNDTRYKLVFEAWRTDDAGVSSEEWFNNDDHIGYWGGKLINTFDKNKKYTYELNFVTSAEGSEAGWVFGPNTKLKINGKEVGFTRDNTDNEQSFSVKTNITMIPTSASQGSSATNNYNIIKGSNGSCTKNSDGTITFRVDGDISKFVGIKVDGSWINSENYVTASGSTIVTLKNKYLQSLSSEKHKITFVYTDGEVSTSFETQKTGEIQSSSDKIKESEKNSNNPKTADNSKIFLWSSLFIVNFLGVLVLAVYSRKKKCMI